jgi:hypothetical protein
MAIVLLIGAGVGWRISVDGRDAFLNGVVAKSQGVVRGLAKKVSF